MGAIETGIETAIRNTPENDMLGLKYLRVEKITLFARPALLEFLALILGFFTEMRVFDL
jgi:hypothetical protein